MPPVGFEPTISAGERPQTYALDRAATGTGDCELVGTFTQQHNCLLIGLLAQLSRRSSSSFINYELYAHS